MIDYALPGSRHYQERLYPDPAKLDAKVRVEKKLDTPAAVIAYFTASSLAQDGILIAADSLSVTAAGQGDGYRVRFMPQAGFETRAAQFAAMHVALLDAGHAGLALDGADACRRTAAWNPMAGFPVNRSDGPSEWLPCLPLGMPIACHRAAILMHYPPIVAYRTADYLNNMTLRRWAQLLTCAGIDEPSRYHAIIDVNPIAAPGSGESEYQNDYFPINLTSMFFDSDDHRSSYVRSMLELMLDPPANAGNPSTLPLLVCGSPLYDPQAAGWFRTRFKDQLPKDQNGSPTVDVLQAGFVRLHPGSAKKTPYMIANHMIAAGVTGTCTATPGVIPDIRAYEAQDLTAASFLGLCAQAAERGVEVDPKQARDAACQRWFGNTAGTGAPVPASEADRLTICALAQMDLCFDPKTISPTYTFAQATARCQAKGGADMSPCFGCAPF